MQLRDFIEELRSLREATAGGGGGAPAFGAGGTGGGMPGPTMAISHGGYGGFYKKGTTSGKVGAYRWPLVYRKKKKKKKGKD